MKNFIIKELRRKGKLCTYCLIPEEGFVLVRKSDGFKSENPFSFASEESAQKIIDDFYTEEAENTQKIEP